MSTSPRDYNVLENGGLEALKASHPERFEYRAEGGAYLNLRGVPLAPFAEIDEEKIAVLARVVRGLSFAAVDSSKSGHPGGSSSKTDLIVTLLASGVLGFDAWNPKHPGRDRVVWSAGHCSPLLHSMGALVYETLRRKGEGKSVATIYPEDLAKFRKFGGPSGHIESDSVLADTSSGSSGHGLSVGLGFSLLHRGSGLATRSFVMMGDAETEEGMTYEARNVASTLGLKNLVVTLDYNQYGIDGPIFDAMPGPYLNHWFAPGWNVIEIDGHNIREIVSAYRLIEQGFGADEPTVVMAHCIKGLHYGKLENTSDSHGSPLPHADYVAAMKKIGFDIPGKEGDAAADIAVVANALDAGVVDYFTSRLKAAAAKLKPEAELKKSVEVALQGRPLVDYRSFQRPAQLPAELVFEEGSSVATRKATEAWFGWAMKNTAFFYVGSGDLMKSILTGKAENVYGVASKKNPLGRGLRFGIAEQNMAMMSAAIAQDTLPGGFRPMSAFATYGVFTPMMANSVRMTLINNDVNPHAKAFFVMLAAHDGPETGEDGPTHHGLFWMSLFNAYPGIKVYKPMDANETIEMLFYAAQRGEPIALSVARPGTPVLKRGNGIPPAIEAINGAYVFRQYRNNGKPKKVLAVCGGQVMVNLLEVLPQIEESADVKIVAVTAPQLYEELAQTNPAKAQEILSDAEREHVVTLHNGWPGFLYPFLLPADYNKRAHGMHKFSRSGAPKDVYADFGFSPAGLKDRVLASL